MLCSYELSVFLIILCVVLIIISIGTVMHLLITSQRLHRILDEMNSMLYTLTKETSVIHKTTTSLSTSIESTLSEYKEVKNEQLMPQPPIVEMIDKTIQDLLNIELAMTSNQKIIRKDILEKIILNTCATYPQIDESYIIKKCTAILQNLSIQNNEDES